MSVEAIYGEHRYISFGKVLNKTQQLIDFGGPGKSLSPTESPKERPNLFRSTSERQSAKIEHSLARSLSLDNKKVTRSKVTNYFEHTELTFGRKPRVKKIFTIKLEEAFKLVPICTGEDDIYPFINACDMAVNLVEEKCAPMLVKYITTRLSGRALEMIKYKNVTKWVYINGYLMEAFEDTPTASRLVIGRVLEKGVGGGALPVFTVASAYDWFVRRQGIVRAYCVDAREELQIQLNSIKMRHGEDVNDYCHTVEKLYYKLCTACTLNKEESEAKARNPKTLEIAKQLAKAEEIEYNSNILDILFF
ncbi:hypothetical protein AGLY_013926 [Aphis glycines]|uniref:Uncharacterized protein n=1 Tax=Aphis glycines TaxID=307491 RepID=A0A6G0T4W5_APHGL|nr:hypothetical protein AGLY_013926 [Aphis glycines]